MRAVVLPVLLAVLAVGVIACQKSESITIQNTTSRTIVVYEDGEPSELIRAGSTESFDVGSFRGTLKYEVRYLCEDTACDQSILVSRTFTWDEIKQAGGVTITVGSAVSD